MKRLSLTHQAGEGDPAVPLDRERRMGARLLEAVVVVRPLTRDGLSRLGGAVVRLGGQQQEASVVVFEQEVALDVPHPVARLRAQVLGSGVARRRDGLQ
jgi:hypothetical protein